MRVTAPHQGPLKITVPRICRLSPQTPVASPQGLAYWVSGPDGPVCSFPALSPGSLWTLPPHTKDTGVGFVPVPRRHGSGKGQAAQISKVMGKQQPCSPALSVSSWPQGRCGYQWQALSAHSVCSPTGSAPPQKTPRDSQVQVATPLPQAAQCWRWTAPTSWQGGCTRTWIISQSLSLFHLSKHHCSPSSCEVSFLLFKKSNVPAAWVAGHRRPLGSPGSAPDLRVWGHLWPALCSMAHGGHCAPGPRKCRPQQWRPQSSSAYSLLPATRA